MNYIQEIKAFYDWLETNELRASAIVLWHALMHIANKTGWQDEFAAAISIISIKTGLKKDAIEGARNLLVQKGRITFKSRSGNRSAIYKIIPFATFKPPQFPAQQSSQSPSQPTPINKQNETKLNIKNTNLIDSFNKILENETETLKLAIFEFINFRDSLKKPFLTDLQFKKWMHKLKKMGSEQTQIAVIEQSIANGWQGIFELKKNEDQHKNRPSRFCNYMQRDWNFDELEKMEIEWQDLNID